MSSLGGSEPLMHLLVKYLVLASSLRKKENDHKNRNSSSIEDSFIQPMILQPLVTWLADCPKAVYSFLDSRPHLTFLLELVSSPSVTVCVRGLAAVLLGECVIYNKSGDNAKDSFMVVDAISQKIGLTSYLLKFDEMQKKLEQKTGESDGVYIKRLKSFVEKQCIEMQDLLGRNATLAEELMKAGGGGSSEPDQRASNGGRERVHTETLRRDLQEAMQRIEMLKSEKIKIEADASMYSNLASEVEADLKSLSDAYNSLEQANFRLESEVNALRKGEPYPDIEALEAEARKKPRSRVRQN
ncbi:hypothetical protein NE237_019628 [Protea cynaroides]|uniref:Uncharacterized protein n=1 Tax=Protea cynaroides TaxID=273540 RepID=A0A9Q0K347_9MAGN|nr:hypothetical protein NE237_019628 [Protea cynaroides]